MTVPLLIDLAGVARLAKVQRPVVSMWRSRFAATADAFPAAQDDVGGRAVFDAVEVAQWLARTSHGSNDDAVADAAALAAPPTFDIANADHVASVDALLTVCAQSELTLAETTLDGVRAAARTLDPHDEMLLRELRHVPAPWLAWVDQMADAAYSPLEASRVLERRSAAYRAGDGSAGALSEEATAMVRELAAALAPAGCRTVMLAGNLAPDVALSIMDGIGSDEDAVLADDDGARAIRRRLMMAGRLVAPARSGDPVLAVVRATCAARHGAREALTEVEAAMLDFAPGDRGLIIAPAAVLTDELERTAETLRADILRAGRVRAMVRLPAGLVSAASREALAIWVVGDAPQLAIAQRFTALADLTGVAVTPVVTADLAADLLASLGGRREVIAHAFRFVRIVRTASLLAARDSLVSAARGKGARQGRERPQRAAEVLAVLDQLREQIGLQLPLPLAASNAVVASRSVRDLIDERHLQLLPGCRINDSARADSGLVVIGVAELEAPERMGQRRVDPLLFAQLHPAARLTQPGDVVFAASPLPRAWVDREGSAVIEAPARVFRINPGDPGALVPEVIAADIAASPGGAGAWKRWEFRRLERTEAIPLRDALKTLADARSEVLRQLAALDTYTNLLTNGVTSGVVTLNRTDSQ